MENKRNYFRIVLLMGRQTEKVLLKREGILKQNIVFLTCVIPSGMITDLRLEIRR